MQQRASLCRALIHDPTLLLLDEPFGALDQFTREELWETLQQLWLDQKPTVLLVTHDLRESAYLANRIIVMSARPGRIIEDQQVSFARPRNVEMTYEPSFVALTHRLRSLIIAARSGQQPVNVGEAAWRRLVHRRAASTLLIIGVFACWGIGLSGFQRQRHRLAAAEPGGGRDLE